MTERNDDLWADEEFEDLVRHTAYLLWERDGPEGAEKHYWFLASSGASVIVWNRTV